jgi:hypothetical protein
MMYHHDSRDYDFALSEAAKTMRDRLHGNIEFARNSNERAIERIKAEVPQDKIVRARAMTFDYNKDGKFAVQYKTPGSAITPVVEETVHKWAFGQIAEFARVPKNYLQHLMGLYEAVPGGMYNWGAKLACENLNQIFAHTETEEKRLLRSVETEARGFLSTKYKRRHPGHLIDGFAGACKQFDLLPYTVTATDTKHMVRAVLDGIVEPVPNECLGIGVVYAESPYGNGATSVSIFIERMWCTNQAVLSTDLRSAHVGGRLSDDFAWSEETYLADTKATIFQVRDMMEAYVSPPAIRRLCATVKLAHETKIEPKQLEAFIKKNLTKENAEAVADVYRSADVEMLPAGNTVWRASNALSFFAGKVEDEELRFDIQKLAGQLLEPMAKVVEKGKK